MAGWEEGRGWARLILTQLEDEPEPTATLTWPDEIENVAL